MKEGSFHHGDFIKVTTNKGEFKGVAIPSEERDFLVIKLENGYNIGIRKKEIASVEVMSIKKQKNFSPATYGHAKGLKKIGILHTGGTIASMVDYETGGVVAKFKPEELINMFPEVKKIANIESRLLSNMFSENMRFAHYNLMAREIVKEIERGVKGVIITHGTDTLAYTAAALSFMFGELPIPVILVGAQRSSDRGSSDAAMNFICACEFIAKTDFAGVAICSHKNSDDDVCCILPGTKTRKMHTSRRDTFRPINASPLAEIDYKTRHIRFFEGSHPKVSEKKPAVRFFKESIKVGMLYAHPNMYKEEFSQYKNFDGLVLIGTGLGHIPFAEIDSHTKEHSAIKKEVEKLAKKEVVIVMAPQTIYGSLGMNVYAPGRELQQAGVLGNYSDMTPETTFIKLAWLLSNYKKEEVKNLIGENVRGEINKRVTKEEFLN